jgi:hypothetical protein
MLHIVTYIAIFVAWMLIWSRRGTHTAGLHRHSPFRDQYKYYSSRQLAANPWLRENTSRHAVTYGSVTGPVQPSAAAWGPTCMRRLCTHTAGIPCPPFAHTTYPTSAYATTNRPLVSKKRQPAPDGTTPYGQESTRPPTHGTKPAEIPWHSPIENNIDYIISGHHITPIQAFAAAECLKLKPKIVTQPRL